MKISPKNTVNAYDFDHTIYRGDASFDFIIFCLTHHPLHLRYLPAQAWAILLYVLGMRSRKQIKQVAFSFLKSIKNIDKDLDLFWAKHERKLETWYLQQKQPTDTIISASPAFLLQPIVTKLEVSTLIATRMNKKTGKITGENCRGEEKVTRLQQLPSQPAIENAYSDSRSDLPLLKLAKNAYIVRKGTVTKLDNLV